MPDRWFMNGFEEWGFREGYYLKTTTDAPCHLWLRWTLFTPRKHKRAKKLRGVWLMGDVYFCFVATHDLEQVEAGDTTTHTFIMTNWPACETRWMYLWGTIGGVLSPSESQFWGRHLYFTYHSYYNTLVDPSDSVFYNGTLITSAPPSAPIFIVVGRESAPADTIGGAFRFRNLWLPKYAEILNARLYLLAMSNQAKVPVHCQLAFENDPNPGDFYNIDIPTFLARWANRFQVVNWNNMPPWSLLTWEYSPVITTGLQAIVNKYAYAPYNSCVVFWDDFLQRTPWQAFAMRLANSTYFWPAYAPYLAVLYNHWQVSEVTV